VAWRAIFTPSGFLMDGKHPGFRERVALRGVTRERGPWSVHEDGGNIQPAVRRVDDTQGCSRSSFEEGNLHRRRSAAAGGERVGPSLGATRPVQSSAVVQRPSPQTVVGSRRRPQAAFPSDNGFRGLALRRACSVRGVGLGRAVAVRSARDPSSRGEGRRALNTHRESESRFDAAANGGGVRNAKIGCSGVCPCVGKSVAEIVGRQPDPEKCPSASRVNSARRGGGQGRGSSSRQPSSFAKAKFRDPWVNGRRGPDRRGNTRDRERDRYRPTHVRGCPRRWKAPRVVESVPSSRRGEGIDLGNLEGKSPPESAEQDVRERRRCQRYGSIGSAGEIMPCVNLDQAYRSGFGVVKRQVHRSPGRGCKPSAKGEA